MGAAPRLNMVRFQGTVLVPLAILALAALGAVADWTRAFSAVVPETIDTDLQSTYATEDPMRDFEVCVECIEKGLKQVRTNYIACAEAADQCQELQEHVLHSHPLLISVAKQAQRDAHDITPPDQEVIDIQIDNHHQQLLETSNQLAAHMKQCVDDRTTCAPGEFEAKVRRALVDVQHLSEDASSANDLAAELLQRGGAASTSAEETELTQLAEGLTRKHCC